MAEPGQSEEDKMAAEWAAMAEGPAAEDPMAAAMAADGTAPAEGAAPAEPDAGGTVRVLNQDEIDSLLGFDSGADSSGQSGIMALVNSALVNYERLPMLEVVFDRLVRVMSTSLRNFTSDNVDVSIDSISSVRFGDYMNSIPLPAMLGVFKAEEWDNYGLMVIDSSMIYSIVDVLLGGRRGTAAMRIEGRPYTTIERNLVERMIHVITADMSAAFDPLSPVTFRFDRLETNPRFVALTRSTNAAVLARLRVDMEDRGGRLEIIIPYATLEPIRELLLQMFMGEKFGRDSIWETHLGNELLETDIDITAVLHETGLSLTEILSWKPGSQVMFNMTKDDMVSLRCGEVPLFEGKLGQAGGHIAVKIEKEAPEDEHGGSGMNPLLTLALDITIIGLLTVTIFSVWALGGKLKAFISARKEFENVIMKFDAATSRAEDGIHALEEASKRAGKDLQGELDRARDLREELLVMVSAGENMAKRLEAAVPSRSEAKPVTENDVRSKAERDLLRAMEGKR